MKRKSILSIFSVVLFLTLTSCTEDKWVDWKVMNEKWYEMHKDDPGYKKTDSGLCYKVIHQGLGSRVSINSYIKAEYTGTLIDGTVFDSGTLFRQLSSTIEGWQEGISKMNVGGEYHFYIPANLAYGTKGSGTIGPNSVLIFKVKLLDPNN